MHPAIRTTVDGLNDEASLEAGLDCGAKGEIDTARQEFREDADINNILKRYGINAPQRPLNWQSVIDYDLDLQSAMVAIHQVRDAHTTLPQALRKDYPTWQSMVNGIATGTLRADLANYFNPPNEEPTNEPTPNSQPG